MKEVVDEKVLQVKEAIKKFGEETVEKIVTRKKRTEFFILTKNLRNGYKRIIKHLQRKN